MKTLFNVKEVSAMIQEGKKLLLAGNDSLMSQLPRGAWVGGTIPYFMSEWGGIDTSDMIQVVELPDFVSSQTLISYGAKEIQHIPKDYKDNGVSFIIIPAFSEVHKVFAKECMNFSGLFDSPLLGWVSGYHLQQDSKKVAKVYDGFTGQAYSDRAVVLHLGLAKHKYGKVNILNLFKQGYGDVVRFQSTGFEATTCLVNGESKNLFEYIKERGIDTQLPLVANYSGAMINVSVMSLNEANKSVQFYAPVFSDVDYKFANPVMDYEAEFEKVIKNSDMKNPTFTCNCILNFLYANLEGKKTADIVGPMTFGEIAYMLLNQTMVYLTFEDR
ncbi:hypothetical protein AZI87_14520 [Bdellovibrio bacteriovorus]|uniref:Uncharacterized protein n=1 Tax=Bdellovibrio bacteriovorus TaxID=959 RepID=A0A161QFE1_BDEBC|nr:hypothetical protein [Bdellovibrio bacteriovorus]KYG63607.1 hypothetical protein AZI87_14520 [Bdellovibrio bacteriovorus]